MSRRLAPSVAALAMLSALAGADLPRTTPPSPAPSNPTATPTPTRTRIDLPTRRAQAEPGDMPAIPGSELPILPPASLPADAGALEGGMPLGLDAALYGTLNANPDLVALRQTTTASAEAVEVARRFPTTLNPVLWIDVRPLVYERVPGTRTSFARLDQKDALMYFSLRQPLELGHQTTHRHAIAKAAYNQTQWAQVQAELLALVQTYRFFQTAAYRREKFRVARQLSTFNDTLVGSLRRRLEASQATGVDVALAEVESEATRQQAEAARQDYITALTDLRTQMGLPETASLSEPLGDFVLPQYIPDGQEAAFIKTALCNRPEIHSARAGVRGALAAVKLAKGDRIPTPVVGPVYERDEQGTQFFGFVYITPIPVLNNGTPLVRQREAEYRRAIVSLQQIEHRTVAQVKAALAKWNGANQLVARTAGLTTAIERQVSLIERLFEENQTDLTKLLQARQRLIQLENARLDAIWAATQAQADLLTALGAPTLIGALQARQPTAAPTPPSPVTR